MARASTPSAWRSSARRSRSEIDGGDSGGGRDAASERIGVCGVICRPAFYGAVREHRAGVPGPRADHGRRLAERHRDDTRQVAAAEAFVSKGAWVSLLVLAEATWVLSAAYDRSAEELATAIEMLLNHRDLTVQDAEVAASALDHFRRKPALGFSDCLSLEIARKAGHRPLGTFDVNLAKLEGAERLKGQGGE